MTRAAARVALAAAAALLVRVGAVPGAEIAGTVVSASTGRPIPAATVTLGERVATADLDGAFRVEGDGDTLLARAVGHGRVALPLAGRDTGPIHVELPELHPKALYLSIYGAADARLRDPALAIAAATEVNALVLDVKSDSGRIGHASVVPLAAEAGAVSRRTLESERARIASLHERGLYLIARIVVFKDRLLAEARPDLAVKTSGGAVWHDREGSAWVDPFREEVRAYGVALAVEAARLGFDEIQLDYVRFPDATGLRFARPSTQASRIEAVDAFLAETRRRLVPFNVFLSADVFGYVCWNTSDTMIGQRLEDLAPLVDYVSPMLYPSSFQFGIPGVRVPVDHPYEIVLRSLERARERVGLPALRFRPWLQAFRDYAFDRRAFAGDAIRAQIRAAETFGSNGWMLWNPGNVYHAGGLAER